MLLSYIIIKSKYLIHDKILFPIFKCYIVILFFNSSSPRSMSLRSSSSYSNITFYCNSSSSSSFSSTSSTIPSISSTFVVIVKLQKHFPNVIENKFTSNDILFYSNKIIFHSWNTTLTSMWTILEVCLVCACRQYVSLREVCIWWSVSMGRIRWNKTESGIIRFQYDSSNSCPDSSQKTILLPICIVEQKIWTVLRYASYDSSYHAWNN